MNKFLKLPVFILLLVPTLSISQERAWSLEACIKYAWDNNITIKQQELSVEQSENNLFQSKMNYLPSINASIGHSMNWGRSVNMNDLQIIENKLTQSTNASASASLTLFEGMVKHKEVKSREVMREIATHEVGRAKNDISIEIARIYLQVLLAKEILNTANTNLESTSQQLERTKKLVDAGSQPYSTLLEMEAQYAGEMVTQVSAVNQVTTALLSLKQLLDLPNNDGFDIESPAMEFKVYPYSTENADDLFRSSAHLPQLKIAQLNRENAELQLSIAKGQAYPSVSFRAGYGTYYADSRDDKFMDQFNENRNPSISFGLNIPIFNSWRTNSAIKNAKIGVKMSALEQRNREQLLYKEISQAINDANSYYSKYLATERNVKAMEESFRYVEQKFEVGVLNATDYTVAKNNLFKSKSDYSQAKYQYIFQQKIIDFYKGNPISL